MSGKARTEGSGRYRPKVSAELVECAGAGMVCAPRGHDPTDPNEASSW